MVLRFIERRYEFELGWCVGLVLSVRVNRCQGLFWNGKIRFLEGGGARYNIATLSYVIIIKKMIINTFSGYTRSGIFSSDAANTMLQHSHAPE